MRLRKLIIVIPRPSSQYSCIVSQREGVVNTAHGVAGPPDDVNNERHCHRLVALDHWLVSTWPDPMRKLITTPGVHQTFSSSACSIPIIGFQSHHGSEYKTHALPHSSTGFPAGYPLYCWIYQHYLWLGNDQMRLEISSRFERISNKISEFTEL